MRDEQDGFGVGPLRQLAGQGAALLLLALATAAASAAERRVDLSSFERIRVEGPFQVTLATGRSPRGMVSGDARVLDRIELRQDGTTLVVRGPLSEAGATARAAPPTPAPTLTLTTLNLVSAAMLGGGVLTITGGKGQRLDASVTGPGTITWTGATAEQVNALVIGNGAITLGGRASAARMLINGAGKIAADTLQTDAVTIRVDGPGEVAARARYTATITNAGLGHVTVAGTPKCEIKSAAGGPVSCGAVTR